MHRETSKFKQSVLTIVSPVSSIGITDNKIYDDVRMQTLSFKVIFIVLNTWKLLMYWSLQKTQI